MWCRKVEGDFLLVHFATSAAVYGKTGSNTWVKISIPKKSNFLTHGHVGFGSGQSGSFGALFRA